MTNPAKPNAPRKLGRKLWEPTNEERLRVRNCIALGLNRDQIGLVMGKSADSLQRHCAEELALGKLQLIEKIGGGLVIDALAGCKASRIFWLKTQAGWSESTIHKGPDGGPILHSLRVELVDGEFPDNQAGGPAET